jgi:pimeloyl-ACP methyl ester carboxylesterase
MIAPMDGVRKIAAGLMDVGMCEMMNLIQWRQRDKVSCPQVLGDYLKTCADVPRNQFYHAPAMGGLHSEGETLVWDSPVRSGFPENDRPFVRLFCTPEGASAPTVLILHALMSASDIGYRKMAAWFNARGWNAAFPHLPYHYSRVPKGTLNGELAITSNLVRNVESLRQGVVELRQLMTLLRGRGCREFGILGTSYGGWTGALLSFVEPDFRFLALVQPIVDTRAAIWENPAARSLRRQLERAGVDRDVACRHAHLSSPMHGLPLCGTESVFLAAGLYDTVSPPDRLVALHERWPGSRLLIVPQGHFGYLAHQEMLRALDESGILEPQG